MIPFRDALFIFIAMAEIHIDFSHPHTESCIKHKGLHVFLILLFHHLFSTFIMWGWLIPNRKFLFLFIIVNALVLLEWLVHRRSYLTMQLNNVCGWKSDTPLRDIMWWFGLKDIHLGGLPLHIMFAVLFLLLGVYLYHS